MTPHLYCSHALVYAGNTAVEVLIGTRILYYDWVTIYSFNHGQTLAMLLIRDFLECKHNYSSSPLIVTCQEKKHKQKENVSGMFEL